MSSKYNNDEKISGFELSYVLLPMIFHDGVCCGYACYLEVDGCYRHIGVIDLSSATPFSWLSGVGIKFLPGCFSVDEGGFGDLDFKSDWWPSEIRSDFEERNFLTYLRFLHFS